MDVEPDNDSVALCLSGYNAVALAKLAKVTHFHKRDCWREKKIERSGRKFECFLCFDISTNVVSSVLCPNLTVSLEC